MIEAIRQIRPNWTDAELAHRLDRDTSGVLIVCKNSRTLRNIQGQFKEKRIEKRYHALVQGRWPDTVSEIKAPLTRVLVESGERFVRVDPAGKPSTTRFAILEQFPSATLLEATPVTGERIKYVCIVSRRATPFLGTPNTALARGRGGKSGSELARNISACMLPNLNFSCRGPIRCFRSVRPGIRVLQRRF